jgi:hypothetical protein
MAKRSRLGGRPGQRRPLQRAATRPSTTTPTTSTTARPAASVTAEELARAAELEAAIVAEEKAVDDARRNRNQGRRPAEGAIYSSVPLSTRAAEEYGYVRRDVRRIAIVGGSLLAVLAILEVLVNVLHLI